MSEKQMETALSKVNGKYFPMIEKQLTGNGIKMDDYAKQCVINAISAIHTALDAKGITWGDSQIDHSNITQILLSIASLKLNASASPREVYFQVDNVKTALKDESGKDVWKKKVKMDIEGDGNDSILARFGRDVAKVGQFWQVREGDEFTPPEYNGFDVTPPKWKPLGKGNVVKVVYPIKKNDGSVEFHIAERDDVAKNLIAHINNNMRNETFGINKDRFTATAEQKAQIDAKKAEVLKKARDAGLAALDLPELQKYISPAWTEYHSREQMIIRKMRNNVVKKIPKDFGNAFVEMTYAEQTDEVFAAARREIASNANNETIDVASEVVYEKEPEVATTTEKPPAPPAAKPGPDF